MADPISPVPQSTPEQHAVLLARRRRRSVALGVVLGAMVLIFYVLTIVKLGPHVFDRAL